MTVTNIIIAKIDTNYENLGINLVDTVAEVPDVNLTIDYSTLDAGQKAIADAFYAMAISLLPA